MSKIHKCPLCGAICEYWHDTQDGAVTLEQGNRCDAGCRGWEDSNAYGNTQIIVCFCEWRYSWWQDDVERYKDQERCRTQLPAAIEEGKRLVAYHEWGNGGMREWPWFALVDWLDERNFPLNSAAVRLTQES